MLRCVCKQLLNDAKARYGPQLWFELGKQHASDKLFIKSEIPPGETKIDLSDVVPKEQLYGPLAALTLERLDG